MDGETLVFVEVRQRARSDFGGALASVTPAKRRKLLRTALFHWQRRKEWQGRVLRFDVIAVDGEPDGTTHIAWIKDAFRAN